MALNPSLPHELLQYDVLLKKNTKKPSKLILKEYHQDFTPTFPNIDINVTVQEFYGPFALF